MWQNFMRLNADALCWSEPGLALDQPIYLLLGLGGTHEASLRSAFERIFEETQERYPSSTGIIASSVRQEAALWRLREDTEIVYRALPNAPSYDVSVPLSRIEAYAAAVQAGLVAIDPALQPFMFGHLADGNLHIILNRPGPLAPELVAQVEEVLYRDLQALGGSFSAEHGVGSKRIGAMVATTDPVKLRTMHQVKRLLDPALLMNPGKVLPL